MQLLDGLRTRRSVRRFGNQPVSSETLRALAESAAAAPSAMNSQPWAFHILRDSARLRAISTAAKAMHLDEVRRTPALARYEPMLTNPEFNIFYNAPVLVTVYARPEGPSPVVDSCLAAQNFMLAAHAHGLGSCWIGWATAWLNREEFKRDLGIPMEWEAVAPLILGYPEADTLAPSQRRPPVILGL